MTEDQREMYHKEVQADKEQAIPSALRLQQMEALEIYYKAALEDDTVKPFLINVAKKLNKILQKLDVPHKEEK